MVPFGDIPQVIPSKLYGVLCNHIPVSTADVILNVPVIHSCPELFAKVNVGLMASRAMFLHVLYVLIPKSLAYPVYLYHTFGANHVCVRTKFQLPVLYLLRFELYNIAISPEFSARLYTRASSSNPEKLQPVQPMVRFRFVHMYVFHSVHVYGPYIGNPFDNEASSLPFTYTFNILPIFTHTR